MKNTTPIKQFHKWIIAILLLAFTALPAWAEVTLVDEYKVSDVGLFFDGRQLSYGELAQASKTEPTYDFKFGGRISPHGDCIKKLDHYIFTTWYRGGKFDRHVMLSRYNTQTGVLKTIEFPHQHTGFRGDWWIGESHNTIAVGISPKDGRIHMLYDMHSYNNNDFRNDYFRYAYSKENAATVPDEDFKLNLFVKDNQGDYTHVSLNGTPDPS